MFFAQFIIVPGDYFQQSGCANNHRNSQRDPVHLSSHQRRSLRHPAPATRLRKITRDIVHARNTSTTFGRCASRQILGFWPASPGGSSSRIKITAGRRTFDPPGLFVGAGLEYHQSNIKIGIFIQPLSSRANTPHASGMVTPQHKNAVLCRGRADEWSVW